MNVSIVLKLFDGVTAPIRRVSQAIDEASKAIEKTKERADKVFERADRIKQSSESMRRFATEIKNDLGVVVEAASDFEKAMLGVAKQVDGARDPSGKLTAVYDDMAKQIQILGREMPMTTTSIAEMVAAGARMGVVKDELIDFTRTAAMMAEAFELPAGDLAEQMGKIKGLFSLTTPEVRKLADSVNYLDDNAISKGGDIITFLQRTGGVAGSVKVTATQMAALGSTLLTLGEHAWTASTATNNMFQKFAAANKGTKEFKAAMHQIGLSTQEVQKGMQTDAQGTILKVMDAVNELPKDQRVGVLVSLVGLENSDTLAKLAVNVAEYRKQIDLANSQKAEGSMSREFQARLATTSAQWEILKNRAAELAVNVGSKLLPEINKLFDLLGPLVTKTAEWVQENPKLVKTLGALAAIAAVVATAFAAIMTAISAMLGAYGVLLLAKSFGIFSLVLRASLLPSILGVLPAMGAFIAELWAMAVPAIVAAAPFLALAAAVVAVGAALLQLIRLAREWEELDFGEVFKGVDAAISDRSFWKTLTLNPFSGLNDVANGRSGGLQPLGASEAPMGTLVVKFDENNQPVVKSMEASGFNLEAEANSGRMMSY